MGPRNGRPWLLTTLQMLKNRQELPGETTVALKAEIHGDLRNPNKECRPLTNVLDEMGE